MIKMTMTTVRDSCTKMLIGNLLKNMPEKSKLV